MRALAYYPNSGTVRIVVNGEEIDEEWIRREAQHLRPHLVEAMPEASAVAVEERLRDWSRENVIELFLLRQAAVADREPLETQTVEEALARQRAESPGQSGCRSSVDVLRDETSIQLRINRLVSRHAGRIALPRHKEIVEYYRKHREEFQVPELVHASHIVKKVSETCTEEEALAAMRAAEAELCAGVPFEDVADRVSDCPGRGGDLGWFPRGEMVDQFDEVVFSLGAGSVSPIFLTAFGYHIVKVHAKTPPRAAALEEVRDRIEQHLMAQKRQRALERFIDHLRARAVIEMHP